MYTHPPKSPTLRLSNLSPQRQHLVRLCQRLNFGSIRGLAIREGDPVFDPPPLLFADVKLDRDDPPRPETELADFDLVQEVVHLMNRLDDLITTTIELLEIRAGIPRRVVFRAAVGFTTPAEVRS
jgi:hypothetical protein